MGTLTEESVLETLRRVPDRIILATMGRDLDLQSYNACLCGWFVREKLAEIRNVGASTVDAVEARPWSETQDDWTNTKCVKLFGGTTEEWDAIFYGVEDETDDDGEYRVNVDLPVIESAFVRRVHEAVYPRRRRSAKRRSRTRSHG